MITRNNYEEFFLLYVDDELSPADRHAVERFAGEHPDLKEELELLLQCRIKPDESPSFPDKASLLIPVSQVNLPIPAPQIDLNNYETWFLSFLDNELDAPSRQAVIDFLRRHPEKNKEWQQLQRTVSAPDLSVTFPDKGLLYRGEGQRRRKIAWLPFAGMAAAALILGAVGLLIFHPFTAKQQLASTVDSVTSHPKPGNTATPGTASVTKKMNPAVTSAPPHPYYSTKKDDGQQIALASHKDSGQQVASIGNKDGGQQVASIRNKDDGRQLASATRKEDRTAAPVLVKVDPVRPNTTDPARDMAIEDPTTIDRTARLPVTLAVAVSADQPRHDATAHDATANMNASFATQALLSQANDLSSAEEPSSPRKNKLRGIFRKVTRVLEKPAARIDDDNKKVTIGGFQFALE
jgi:hypothetical protein